MTDIVYIGRADGSVGWIDPEMPPEQIKWILAAAADNGWYRITQEQYDRLKTLPINQPGPVEGEDGN